MKYSLRSLMPKRSWFQFSLKTLLVVMTLFGVVLGRFGYVLERARHHEAEAVRITSELSAACNQPPEYGRKKVELLSSGGDVVTVVVGPREWLCVDGDYIPVGLQYPALELWLTAREQTQLGESYRRALRHPWQAVRVPPKTQIRYKEDHRIWD
jgi:hypothetical protein